jgi:hypothetical protein
MSRGDGVQSLLRLGVGMRADNLADKDYVVAGLGLRLERAFKIRNCIGKQDRIYLFGRGGVAIEFG